MFDRLLLILPLIYSLLLSLGLVKPTKPNVPPRVSISDGGATSGWKPGVAGSGSTHGSESSEELTISVSVTPSPDSQSDTGEDQKIPLMCFRFTHIGHVGNQLTWCM